MAWGSGGSAIVTNLQKQEVRFTLLFGSANGSSVYKTFKRTDTITSYEKRGMSYATASGALPAAGTGDPIVTDGSVFPIGGGGYNARWTEYDQGDAVEVT